MPHETLHIQLWDACSSAAGGESMSSIMEFVFHFQIFINSFKIPGHKVIVCDNGTKI